MKKYYNIEIQEIGDNIDILHRNINYNTCQIIANGERIGGSFGFSGNYSVTKNKFIGKTYVHPQRLNKLIIKKLVLEKVKLEPKENFL